MLSRLVTFIFLFFSGISFSQGSLLFPLDKYGKADFRKQLDADLGLVVYRNGKTPMATILPREYFILGDYNDTLELKLTPSKGKDVSSPYFAECTNCTNISFRHVKGEMTDIQHALKEGENPDRFILSDGEDEVVFRVSFEQSPEKLHHAPIENGFEQDKEIGYIRLQNTIYPYGTVPGTKVNLAVIDMNHNGRADSADFVSLSPDEYFYSAERSYAQKASKVKTIRINDDIYSFALSPLPDPNGNSVVQLTKLTAGKADISYSDQIPDIQLENSSLYKKLDSAGLVIVTHWTEFSADCTSSLPDLNDLAMEYSVIGLHSGNELKKVLDRFPLDFPNVQATEEMSSSFAFSGYPHFMVVDKDKKIVVSTKELSEITKYLESHPKH